jgi:mRNA interferase YafQ
LQERIFDVLDALVRDPFTPALKTHKLSGQLQGLWACWVEYDCRIVFAFETEPQTGEELIVLIDLGTHDEVY